MRDFFIPIVLHAGHKSVPITISWIKKYHALECSHNLVKNPNYHALDNHGLHAQEREEGREGNKPL